MMLLHITETGAIERSRGELRDSEQKRRFDEK